MTPSITQVFLNYISAALVIAIVRQMQIVVLIYLLHHFSSIALSLDYR